MTARRIVLAACLLILLGCALPALGHAQAHADVSLNTTEYRAELDHLIESTQSLDSSGSATPAALHNLPGNWQVSSGQNNFEISTEGLQRDIRRYENERTVAHATAIRTRLLRLRDDLDGYERDRTDSSARRTALDSILSRGEFRDVGGPTWFDRLKERLFLFVIRQLQRLFHSSAIPNIGRFFVYVLMGVALALLVYIAYRNIVLGSRLETVVPSDVPVSAKEWTIWLAEARAAAAKGEWRDAVHLAYWAGISYLEREGMWKPDRARTPREYLRLLSSSSQHRETLASLTRIFELAWYAKRDASEGTFSQTLEQLEKLGCR